MEKAPRFGDLLIDLVTGSGGPGRASGTSSTDLMGQYGFLRCDIEQAEFQLVATSGDGFEATGDQVFGAQHAPVPVVDILCPSREGEHIAPLDGLKQAAALQVGLDNLAISSLVRYRSGLPGRWR